MSKFRESRRKVYKNSNEQRRIYITIDTEMDADIHWKQSWPPEYSSIYEGISVFFRPLWNKYKVHPVYFLSPEVLIDEQCCEILKKEIEYGAIIGAHLHPEYIEPELDYEIGKQKKASQFPCSAYSMETEKAKLNNLTKMITDKLGVVPEWYRAARFGADEDTYKILDELGYKYDSSVTPGIDWSDRGGIDYSRCDNKKYNIQGTNIIEYPILISGKRFWPLGVFLPNKWFLFRWLRPSHMTYIEMKSLVKEQMILGNNELVMMFHSMEPMINKTPYVRNRVMQKYYIWRLEKILSYAYDNGFLL